MIQNQLLGMFVLDVHVDVDTDGLTDRTSMAAVVAMSYAHMHVVQCTHFMTFKRYFIHTTNII